jgi:hypothetical protein
MIIFKQAWFIMVVFAAMSSSTSFADYFYSCTGCQADAGPGCPIGKLSYKLKVSKSFPYGEGFELARGGDMDDLYVGVYYRNGGDQSYTKFQTNIGLTPNKAWDVLDGRPFLSLYNSGPGVGEHYFWVDCTRTK